MKIKAMQQCLLPMRLSHQEVKIKKCTVATFSSKEVNHARF